MLMMMYLQATLTSTPKGKIKTKVAPFFLKQYARSHASNARSSLSSLLSSRAPARGEDGTAVPAPSPAQRDGGCQGRTDPVKVASTAPEDPVKVAEIAAPKLSRSCSKCGQPCLGHRGPTGEKCSLKLQTPEKFRGGEVTSVKEERGCQNCGAVMSPQHQCDDTGNALKMHCARLEFRNNTGCVDRYSCYCWEIYM